MSFLCLFLLEGILNGLQRIQHLVKAGIVSIDDGLLSAAQLHQRLFMHCCQLTALLLTPCPLLCHALAQLCHSLSAELLAAAVGIDLDLKMQKEAIDNLRLLNKSVAGIPNATLTDKAKYVSYDNVSSVYDAKPY